MRDQSDRLELAGAVNAAIGLTYDGIDENLRLALRLLAGHPGPSLTRDQAAALLDVAPADAAGTLGRLEQCYLLRPGGTDRWHVHDLIATFGRARAVDLDPPTARRAATARLYDHLLSATFAAVTLTHPQAVRDLAGWTPAAAPSFTDIASARAWLDTERATLLRAAPSALRHLERVVELATAEQPPSERLAVSLSNMAVARARAGDEDQARELLLRSAAVAAERGWRSNEQWALNNVAGLLVDVGEIDSAAAAAERALALATDLDDDIGMAYATSNLAVVRGAQGKSIIAIELAESALAQATQLDAPDLAASVLNHLAALHAGRGDVPEAIERYRAALDLATGIGETNESDRAREGLSGLGAPDEL